MPEIDAVTRSEIEFHHAHARRMTERCRAAWQAAVPTSTRASRLAREVRQWTGRAASWAAILELLDYPVKVVNGLDQGMPLDLFPELEVAAHSAGLTPGELLKVPKALHYCGRPGCGHGDNVHGPFCFAAGCGCADWAWAPRPEGTGCIRCGHSPEWHRGAAGCIHAAENLHGMCDCELSKTESTDPGWAQDPYGSVPPGERGAL